MRVSKTSSQLEAAAETILQIHARTELENIRRRVDRENVQRHHVDQWEDAIGRFNDTLEKWNGVWNAVGSLSELVSSFYDLSYRSNAESRNVAVGREVRESNLPAYFFEFEKSNIAEILWNKAIAEGIMHAYVAPHSTPEAQSESKASDEEEQEQEEEEASRSESDSEADGVEPNEEFNAEAVQNDLRHAFARGSSAIE